MSRAGLILAGVLAVLFWSAGCTEGTPGGGGGSGASGGTSGIGGSAATGGTGGIGLPVVCASFFEVPADAPIVSTECTYDFDATPAVRDCTTFNVDEEATLRVILEYADDTVPCGYPCVTGGVPGKVNTGDHFDAARRSVVETASFEPGTGNLMVRIVNTLDAFGNLEREEVFDGDGNPTGTANTTYTGDPAKPDTFETRLSDSTLISSGTMTWNGDQLEVFEVTLTVGFIPPARFDYDYNADGSLMKVTWFDIEQDPEALVATFDFAYPFPQATVTTVLPDSTVRSVLIYDFICGP